MVLDKYSHLKEELDFLNDVKEYSHRIFFLQNKADYVGSEDLGESISLRRVFFPNLNIR